MGVEEFGLFRVYRVWGLGLDWDFFWGSRLFMQELVIGFVCDLFEGCGLMLALSKGFALSAGFEGLGLRVLSLGLRGQGDCGTWGQHLLTLTVQASKDNKQVKSGRPTFICRPMCIYIYICMIYRYMLNKTKYVYRCIYPSETK